MAVAEPAKPHTLLLKLAAMKVDADKGTIIGATVAKANVPAVGKYVLLDAEGKITRDVKLAKRKVPVFTDQKTLETLLVAAQKYGPKFKIREDHDDSTGARVGYSANFKLEGDLVSADLTIFKAYRNRELFFEIAAQTPDLIGLSIDAYADYEITGTGADEKALMRILELDAVDVVDAGAITPDGLLFKRGVDTPDNPEPQKTDKMAAPTIEDVMALVTKQGESLASLSATVQKLACPPSPDDAMKKGIDEIKTSLAETRTQLAAQTATIAAMKREKALLGFRGSDAERARLAAAPADEVDKIIEGQKDYPALVKAARAADAKLSASAAHSAVMATPEGSAAYRIHLQKKGVAKFDQAAA